MEKMTRETPEVRSDIRQKEKRRRKKEKNERKEKKDHGTSCIIKELRIECRLIIIDPGHLILSFSRPFSLLFSLFSLSFLSFSRFSFYFSLSTSMIYILSVFSWFPFVGAYLWSFSFLINQAGFPSSGFEKCHISITTLKILQ